MNHTRALSTDKTNDHKDIGLPNAGSKLQLSSSALRFDSTAPGEESFLTLRITPPQANTLVVVSVDDASLFQVATGVERLAFKQTLTFKPEITGSYIHLRYTPERSGRHQSTVTVEAPATAETIQIPLTGRTSGIGLPALSSETVSQRPMSALTRGLLVGGLLLGIGYAGYSYRCQLWPTTCGPSFSTSSPPPEEPARQQPEPVRTPDTAPLSAEPEAGMAPARNRSTARVTERTQPEERPADVPAPRPKPSADVPEQRATRPSDVTVRTPDRALVSVPKQKITPSVAPENPARKAASTAKPAVTQRTQPVAAPATPKPTPKTTPSEESELERVLNREPN